uniref:OTU deubiquitinase, ubiquitin aldehyde binding 2 n=1 Tax=Hucho hucho TaxID=62062 RepID=A0A4W5RPD4_9TELE
ITDGRTHDSLFQVENKYLLEVEAAKYRDICSQYKYMREIRGDGNCFYRALCFGHLESLLQNDRALQRNSDTKWQSLAAGFDENSSKDFLYVLGQCEADEHGDKLLQLFNEQATFDSMVQYLRLLKSAYLQNLADFFSHFVEAPSFKVYCTQEVETMAMECDHVDILALSEALGVSIHIRELSPPCKTAHFDILYPHYCH